MATRINQYSGQNLIATAQANRSQSLQAKPSTGIEANEGAKSEVQTRLSDKLQAAQEARNDGVQEQVDESRKARQVEAQETLSSGRRVDRREAANELRQANEDIAEAQEAKRALEDGREALEDFEAVATERARGEDIQEDKASSLRQRISEAENNAAVREQRRRSLSDARDQQAVAESKSVEPQSTLSLVPIRASGGQRSISAPPPPESDPIVSPRSTDVSTPEAAEDTRDAVKDAINRTRSLEDQVSRFGDGATERADSATTRLREGASRPRLQSSEDARRVADEVARSTIDDSGQASASQPFLSVEAALRVLA
jgi:hypothetical protein